MPYNANEEEKKVQKFWEEKQIFEKSVSLRPENKPYTFYDGPPFATGLPHYGHISVSVIKDIVGRYFSMKGYRVERRWGWDCHGLPIENLVEKEKGFSGRPDILAYGVDKFNEACRDTVLRYREEWKLTIKRMGRFVDMENDYKTMDTPFMESVWWVFSELYKKGLIYEGHKAMHICPHCVTPLSNFEVTDGYKDVKDISVYASFKLKNPEKVLAVTGDVYAIAWTTTPWTLPGNVALAVNKEVVYVVVSIEGDEKKYLLAKELVNAVIDNKVYQVLEEVTGAALQGVEYEPLFPYFKDTENAFRIVAADFVSTESGAGIVHIAPAFGEDDYNLGKREKIPLVQHVGMDGKFTKDVTDFVGIDVKPKDDPTATDVLVIKWLAGKGQLFAKKKIEHSYPHCWRCDTPLLNYATSSWFVKVEHMKKQLLENNQKTSWVPNHMRDGRFGNWLEGAHDWAISRNRFWGTPLPVWKSEDGEVLCVGSVKELETLTGKTVTDLHKHIVDDLVIEKNGKTFKRIPEVLDCWFESGSMPYGQMHYPFENKEKFEAGFPANFIGEAQDQTRGWFYTLHVLATALTLGDKPSIPVRESVPAFQNVIVNGIVLAEDGKKMSKKLKNYPDPNEIIAKYGVDAVRYYLAVSPVMHAENLNFSEAGVREVYNKIVNTLANVLVFYESFAEDAKESSKPSLHVLDIWIHAKLRECVREVSRGLESYALAEAARPIGAFVDVLSTWWLRRSRDRFKGEDEADKQHALLTLKSILQEFSKVLAPFAPFMAEVLYQKTNGAMESVHLELWPSVLENETAEVQKVIDTMSQTRILVELGLSLRAEEAVKVRQVLQSVATTPELPSEFAAILLEELNVKEMKKIDDMREHSSSWKEKEGEGCRVILDTEITEALRIEGFLRDLIRTINQKRKEMKLTRETAIHLGITGGEMTKKVVSQYAEELMRQVIAKEIQDAVDEDTVDVAGESVKIHIQAV